MFQGHWHVSFFVAWWNNNFALLLTTSRGPEVNFTKEETFFFSFDCLFVWLIFKLNVKKHGWFKLGVTRLKYLTCWSGISKVQVFHKYLPLHVSCGITRRMAQDGTGSPWNKIGHPLCLLKIPRWDWLFGLSDGIYE